MIRLRGYGTGPLPHPATQREYAALGGRVGERAGAGGGADVPPHLIKR